MKPNWEDAPEWAKYLAMNENGNWVWHEEMPIKQYRGMSSSYWEVRGNCHYADPEPKRWDETLEEKPIKDMNNLRKENAALKAVLAEVEKQTGQVREILRVAANNMAVLHHD